MLGSATPSLESMYRAKHGEYRLLELKRSGQRAMAAVHTVDLRTGVKKRQSFYFESKAAGINGGALSKKRTDYFVFKPTWVCGIYFLQRKAGM